MKAKALALITLLALLALTLSRPATASIGATAGVAPQPAETDSPQARIAEALRSSPVMFIQNVGQFEERALFQVRGGDKIIWLTEDGIWVTVPEKPPRPKEPLQARRKEAWAEEPPRKAVNIKLSFPGANPHPRLEPFHRLDTVVSYFIGNDPAKWRAAVPVWGGVRYVGLYPGVDLELRGENGQVVPRLVAHPGADLSAVRLRVEGAEEVALGGGGGLLLRTALGEFTLPLFRVEGWSAEPARARRVDGLAFEVSHPFTAGNEALGASSPMVHSQQAVSLLYAGFLGGSGWDDGRGGIAVDASGSAYVTGRTWSSDFPAVVGPDLSHNGGWDAFVAKVNPSGTALVYAGFLGGSGDDVGFGIAVDASGNAYVTGRTGSSNFPAVVGPDLSFNGYYDAFVAKVNPSGTALVYAGFLGGSGWDEGLGIAVDASGSAYVTGDTESSDFPAVVGPDLSYNGGGDAFVAKVGAGGGVEPTVSTLMPESSAEDPLHRVVLKGLVDPKGGTVQVWFEWGTDPNLTTYQIAGTQTVAGSAQTVRATLSLPEADSIGVVYYYRVAAGSPANPQRGQIEPFLILLGLPNRGGVTNRPYWNKFDRLIHYYAHQQNIPPTLVKAIIAQESHWNEDKNNHPEHAFLYELISIDWKIIQQELKEGKLPLGLERYLLPNNPPPEGKKPYNVYTDNYVIIQPGTKNLDMVGICWIETSDVYGTPVCKEWRRKVPSFTPTFTSDYYKQLRYLTNREPPETSIWITDAQYRLASSYGLGQIIYRWHYDRAQRLKGASSPPPPEDLWDPEFNIKVMVDYLNKLRNQEYQKENRKEKCTPSSYGEKDYKDITVWERTARAYNSNACGVGYNQEGAWENITTFFQYAQPALAHRGNLGSVEAVKALGASILSPSQQAALAAQESLLQAGEYEVDRLVADLKGTGQEQLATLIAVVSDPNQGVAYGVLRVFRDAAGTSLEWESPPMEGVLASGMILTSTIPGGGAPLVIAYWGTGAHGVRAYLYRWDGQTFQPIRGKAEDGTEFTGFFGDAGVDIGAEGIWTGSRDGTEPLGVLHFDHYSWNPSEKRFEWIGESIINLREFRVYLPLVLRNYR